MPARAAGGDFPDLVDHFVALDHLAEHGVPRIALAGVVEEIVVLHVDEELRGRRIAHAGARHRDRVVVVLEPVGRLVLDRGVDGLLPHVPGKAAALDHEPGHHAVEDGAGVLPRLDVLHEILRRDGRLLFIELDHDRAHRSRELHLHRHSAFSITTGSSGCSPDTAAGFTPTFRVFLTPYLPAIPLPNTA